MHLCGSALIAITDEGEDKNTGDAEADTQIGEHTVFC